MQEKDRQKLLHILALLGSDQPGERAAAALAAHRLLASLGLDWEAVIRSEEAAEPKVVIQRVRDFDLDQHRAAESRMRQLRTANALQERQIKALRTRVNTLSERERRRLQADAEAED